MKAKCFLLLHIFLLTPFLPLETDFLNLSQRRRFWFLKHWNEDCVNKQWIDGSILYILSRWSQGAVGTTVASISWLNALCSSWREGEIRKKWKVVRGRRSHECLHDPEMIFRQGPDWKWIGQWIVDISWMLCNVCIYICNIFAINWFSLLLKSGWHKIYQCWSGCANSSALTPPHPLSFSEMKNYFHFISRNGESRLFKWKYHFPSLHWYQLLQIFWAVFYCFLYFDPQWIFAKDARGAHYHVEKNIMKSGGKFCWEEKWAIKLPEWWWKEVRVT